MDNKTIAHMDIQRIAQNKKIMKQLPKDEIILMSAVVIKINHVDKHQQRVLAVTNKNILNLASPSSVLPNRIKRKIPLSKVIGISVSHYGNQMVIHVDSEDDYRFSSPNLRNKFIEIIVEAVWKELNLPVKLYMYDDFFLHQYTTTIVDLDNKVRKEPRVQPVLANPQSAKKKDYMKLQSLLVFKAQNNDKIEAFEEFQIIKVLGRGAFGKVMLCKHINKGSYYAVKSMRKENLIDKESIERARTERRLLEEADHPFLVNIEYAFQTRQKIFLVMPFYRGGQMFSRIKNEKCFSEDRTRFYAAQVFLALDYLHKLGYVYRDLKPQNILFDTNGYIKISDYGLSKRINNGQKTYSLVGTPSYLSPEVLLSEGHTFSVDWWCLGVLIYQMLFSAPPFYAKDHKEMFQKIVNKQLLFPKNCTVSDECKSLLRGLLVKYPNKRLGHRSSDDIKNHPWFSGFDWENLLQMKIVPEFIPKIQSQEDVSNFHKDFTSEDPINTLVEADPKLYKQFEKEFSNFQYNRSSVSQIRTTINPQINQQKLQSSVSTPNFQKSKK